MRYFDRRNPDDRGLAILSDTFYARGDSSSANNSSLNVTGTNGVPVQTLVFSGGTSGDIQLDFNNGLPDPDTTVFVNGVEMTFTVQFYGTLPTSNKLSNVGGVDLRGKPISVITLQTGQRLFFILDGSGTLSVMNAFPNGAHAITNVSTNGPILICFVRGTLIATPEGERPVEDLRPGDLVITEGGQVATLMHLLHRQVSSAELVLFPELLPIRITAHRFGPGRPARDLVVSPQHRLLLSGWEVEVHFGERKVLAAAKHLLGPGVRRDSGRCTVDYYHLMFDRHEVVLSEGMPSESLLPERETLEGLAPEALRELSLLFPDRFGDPDHMAIPAARSLKQHEAALLMRGYGGAGQRPR